jgi:DNA mismatch repair protein MutL
MGIIKVLDESTINKIAAGEVIEKPASIIKELIENSIDANASEITIEVKGGGISFIRITDNGKGIEKEDLKNAFLRHATSKIYSDLDLHKISTLGFRGEALASIAAISKVEMMSRTRGADIGHRIYIEGGKIIEEEPCGCPEGTIITVRDVFYNTPARLKFLKSESREGMYITNIVENLAMSHANISFKYKLNDKMIIATRGDGDLKAVILSIYGRDVVNNIIDVNCNKDFLTVKGFIGNSNIAKNNRNYQSTFINGRYVKNKTIISAVEAAYKSMLTINKFPFYVLHIYLNPELVDVNVHPTKAEVKFQDEQIIFKSIYHCIKDSLMGVSPILDKEESSKSLINSLPKINYVQQDFKNELSIKENVNRFNKFEQTEGSSDYSQSTFDIKNKINDEAKQNNFQEESEVKQDYKEEPLRKAENKQPKFSPLAVVGQIHFTYIIAEGPEDMYLIDQHAAHERIYYEKYLSEYNNSSIQSQRLIVAVVINLAPSEKQAVFENIDLFIRLGYEIEEFGGNAVALRAVPLIYGNPEPKELFHELLNDIVSSEKNKTNLIDKIIYTMACKSAVKAGDKLSFKEMNELIEQLRITDNPFTCPHGRPTMIKMSYTELEKKFKRIQ